MNIHGVVLSSWLFIKNSTDVFSTHPLTSSDISFKPGHVHIVCYHQSYWNFSNFQHQCCVWQGLTKKKVKKTKPQASGIKAVWPVTVVASIPPTIPTLENWRLKGPMTHVWQWHTMTLSLVQLQLVYYLHLIARPSLCSEREREEALWSRPSPLACDTKT